MRSPVLAVVFLRKQLILTCASIDKHCKHTKQEVRNSFNPVFLLFVSFPNFYLFSPVFHYCFKSSLSLSHPSLYGPIISLSFVSLIRHLYTYWQFSHLLTALSHFILYPTQRHSFSVLLSSQFCLNNQHFPLFSFILLDDVFSS